MGESRERGTTSSFFVDGRGLTMVASPCPSSPSKPGATHLCLRWKGKRGGQMRDDAPLHLDEAMVTPPCSPLEEQRRVMDHLLLLLEHPSGLEGGDLKS